jgi:hypothetical protein
MKTEAYFREREMRVQDNSQYSPKGNKEMEAVLEDLKMLRKQRYSWRNDDYLRDLDWFYRRMTLVWLICYVYPTASALYL